jgi:hypothetical protein
VADDQRTPGRLTGRGFFRSRADRT